MKKWLITGGCGFIGSSLVQSLCREGEVAIRILDNMSVGTRSALRQAAGGHIEETLPAAVKPMTETAAVELVVGDILDEQLVLSVSRAADIIVHLAANTGVGPSVEDPRSDCTINVIGTFNMLEAARLNKVSRFVFASSGAPVGEVEPPIHEELAAHPVSPYGASKLAGEGYCSCYFQTFGVPTVALRFGNVYGTGSGHKSSVVAKFINRALAGEVLEIYGDGKQTRDFIFIEDLVRAIQLATLKQGVAGEIFQIATAAETTLLELMEILVPIMTKAGIKDVQVRHGAERLGDVKRNYSDTSKARQLLGWQAEYSLSAGLQATMDWFMQRT